MGNTIFDLNLVGGRGGGTWEETMLEDKAFNRSIS